jgi:hypothetical protein
MTQGLYLHKGQHNTQKHGHTSMPGIQTHDPIVQAAEDSMCLRPLGHRDQHAWYENLQILLHKRICIWYENLCGKVQTNATQMMTATHKTVRSLIKKLYINNLLSSPNLYDDLHTRVINCCGTVRQNHKGMSGAFDNKILKLKQGDICARVRSNLTATN